MTLSPTDQAILTELKRLLKKRQDKPGMAANVEHLRQRIAELEAQNTDGPA